MWKMAQKFTCDYPSTRAHFVVNLVPFGSAWLVGLGMADWLWPGLAWLGLAWLVGFGWVWLFWFGLVWLS